MEHLVRNALKQCWELVALAVRVGVAGMFNVMQLLIVTAGCISVGLGGSVRVVTLLATMTSQESGSKDRGAGAGQALTPCLGTCEACQESACNLFRFHLGRHDCGCTGARDNFCELLCPPVLECQRTWHRVIHPNTHQWVLVEDADDEDSAEDSGGGSGDGDGDDEGSEEEDQDAHDYNELQYNNENFCK